MRGGWCRHCGCVWCRKLVEDNLLHRVLRLVPRGGGAVHVYQWPTVPLVAQVLSTLTQLFAAGLSQGGYYPQQDLLQALRDTVTGFVALWTALHTEHKRLHTEREQMFDYKVLYHVGHSATCGGAVRWCIWWCGMQHCVRQPSSVCQVTEIKFNESEEEQEEYLAQVHTILDSN